MAFFLPSILIPALGSIVLWVAFIGLRTVGKNVIAGAFVGVLIPVLGAFVWTQLFPGFESQSGIFLGSVVMAGPSAVGGGLAGWLRAGHVRRIAAGQP